jgi:hypothetical protein
VLALAVLGLAVFGLGLAPVHVDLFPMYFKLYLFLVFFM